MAITSNGVGGGVVAVVALGSGKGLTLAEQFFGGNATSGQQMVSTWSALGATQPQLIQPPRKDLPSTPADHQHLLHHVEPPIQDRVGVHLPLMPKGTGSIVAAWQVHADEAGLPLLLCNVALELGMPMRETRHTTALVRHTMRMAQLSEAAMSSCALAR